MGYEKKVKDIMAHIEEYEKIKAEAPLHDALSKLKKNCEKIKAGEQRHKTILVTDERGKIIGKLSFFDLIKGLVPEPAKEAQHSRMLDSILSSRVLEVADDIEQIHKSFQWLHSSFFDLVKQESKKKVKDVMSPIHALLTEEDSINKAILAMFKENIRQPFVTRDNEIVGVVSLMNVLPELLEIAGDK